MWGREIFFSGCIANALLDRDISVLMINFPSILNRMAGMFSEDRADFIASLGMYDLLTLDALGGENTEYAIDLMSHVIDCRYRNRKPMIIITNLKLDAIKNPSALSHARIYDHILERCAPILFEGRTSGRKAPLKWQHSSRPAQDKRTRLLW